MLWVLSVLIIECLLYTKQVVVAGRVNNGDTAFTHIHLINSFNPACVKIQPYLRAQIKLPYHSGENAEMNPVRAIGFSASGLYITTGSNMGEVAVFSIRDHRTLIRVCISESSQSIATVKFSPDDSKIFVATVEECIYVVEFDPDTGSNTKWTPRVSKVAKVGLM